MGAWVPGLFHMCKAEDQMYSSRYAVAAKMEESALHQVGCGRGLGTPDKVAMGRQGERADGDGGLGTGQ